VGIEEEVRRIISERLKVPESKVVPEASLIEDLGADSLDLVEMAMVLEERFKVQIPDSELEGVKTVGDVVECIRKLKA
jgi:acyl carrier protein